MTATYTFDVFSTLDGFGSYSAGDWCGYWGKQGPELLEHRLELYNKDARVVIGPKTYQQYMQMVGDETSGIGDPWVQRLWSLPITVVSNTLAGPLALSNATLVAGDAVDVVTRLKEASDIPLRSHGSLSMNRSLMAAGLIDRIQITIFPVISGRTGTEPILHGAEDFDIELLDRRIFDDNIVELTYRPTLRN